MAWARSAVVGLAAVAPLPSAIAGRAQVTLRAGGLTVSDAPVTVVRQDPLELELRVGVIDARGSGEGWSVSLGAHSSGGPSTPGFVITGASVACRPGSSCTLPVDDVAYPSAVRLTGARTKVFEAEAGTGLGAQLIDVHLSALPRPPRSISLRVGIVDKP